MAKTVMSIGGVQDVLGTGRKKGGRHVYADHTPDGTIVVIGGGHVYSVSKDRRVSAASLRRARAADRSWRESLLARGETWLPRRKRAQLSGK